MNHCPSVDWKPSHTLKANATGPSMESTTRKKVRTVSISSDAAANISSSRLRNASRILFSSLYIPTSTYMPSREAASVGDQPSSSSCRSNSSSLTRWAVSGLRSMASRSSSSFWARYCSMSSVCPSSILCVPCTMGLSTLFSVPSTSVGKSRMQMPMAKGRSSGYTSTGSARAIDCHTRTAT